MTTGLDYLDMNRSSWNSRTLIHLKSDYYDVKGFLEGRSSLNEIEIALLGDVKGKSVLHLQCHFGLDTISLSRMGAQATGVDLSDTAIAEAVKIAGKTHSDAAFICSDIYNLPGHLDRKFDIVFTSYGTISWLPDLDKWGKIISMFLKPGGKFVFVEFHPVVWMYDDYFERIVYNYFNSGPIFETETGTYADRTADVKLEYVNWNHGIGEVVNSLIRNGLEILSLNEYDYSPYNCFCKAIEAEPGKFRIEHLGNKIPMVYSIVATSKVSELK